MATPRHVIAQPLRNRKILKINALVQVHAVRVIVKMAGWLYFHPVLSADNKLNHGTCAQGRLDTGDMAI